jgi:hypothetical protein
MHNVPKKTILDEGDSGKPQMPPGSYYSGKLHNEELHTHVCNCTMMKVGAAASALAQASAFFGNRLLRQHISLS